MTTATDVRNMVNNAIVREQSDYGLRVMGQGSYNGVPCVLVRDFDGEDWALPVYGLPARPGEGGGDGR